MPEQKIVFVEDEQSLLSKTNHRCRRRRSTLAFLFVGGPWSSTKCSARPKKNRPKNFRRNISVWNFSSSKFSPNICSSNFFVRNFSVRFFSAQPSLRKCVVQNFVVENLSSEIFSSDFFFDDENEAFGRWARRRPSTKRNKRTNEKVYRRLSCYKRIKSKQNRNAHFPSDVPGKFFNKLHRALGIQCVRVFLLPTPPWSMTTTRTP